MKVKSAEFLVSAYKAADFPRERFPEVVLAGRSNVGKSSLINRLSGRKLLAKTSSTPGKTQSINFYSVNEDFLLVDLPGYGYAKAQKSHLRRWKTLIETYFQTREAIALVLHLVDSRLNPMPIDLELARWLGSLGVPRLVIATKADKLPAGRLTAQLRRFADAFSEADVVAASAVSGIGCREIWNRVAGVVHRS